MPRPVLAGVNCPDHLMNPSSSAARSKADYLSASMPFPSLSSSSSLAGGAVLLVCARIFGYQGPEVEQDAQGEDRRHRGQQVPGICQQLVSEINRSADNQGHEKTASAISKYEPDRRKEQPQRNRQIPMRAG